MVFLNKTGDCQKNNGNQGLLFFKKKDMVEKVFSTCIVYFKL